MKIHPIFIIPLRIFWMGVVIFMIALANLGAYYMNNTILSTNYTMDEIDNVMFVLKLISYTPIVSKLFFIICVISVVYNTYMDFSNYTGKEIKIVIIDKNNSK